MAKDGRLLLALEAARAAALSVHSAAGLARGSHDALRLLRAAEGLVRSAVVVMRSSAAPESAPPAAVTEPGRRRRPRGRKGKESRCEGEVEPALENLAKDQDVVMEGAAAAPAALVAPEVALPPSGAGPPVAAASESSTPKASSSSLPAKGDATSAPPAVAVVTHRGKTKQKQGKSWSCSCGQPAGRYSWFCSACGERLS